jgi:hypothetical protein
MSDENEERSEDGENYTDDSTTDGGTATGEVTADEDTADGPAEDSETSGSGTAEDSDTSGSGTAEDEQIEPDRNGQLRVRDLDRAFDLVENAVTTEALGSQATNRLLGVLERAVLGPAETDPDAIAELVALLEELVIEPDELEEANIEGVLSVLEGALGSASADSENTADILAVFEEAITDPTSVDPEDVEQFRESVEQLVGEFSDPEAGQFGSLLASPEMEAPIDGDLDPFRLARLATGMTQRATGYSLESGVRTGTRMAYSVMNAESPSELLTQTRAIALDELSRSGVDIGERQQEWLADHDEAAAGDRPITREELETRGERLLSQSAEIGRDEDVHPAYPQILDQLATDEARILRLLAAEGRQACMDIYEKHYIPFKSWLVAENMSMVGTDAGCRRRERAPLYLGNLARLGLIQFSDEPVENLKRYQVLDAQPHIEAAIDDTRRPKTTYKSMELTDFGIDFCETCLPVEVNHARQRRRFHSETE